MQTLVSPPIPLVLAASASVEVVGAEIRRRDNLGKYERMIGQTSKPLSPSSSLRGRTTMTPGICLSPGR